MTPASSIPVDNPDGCGTFSRIGIFLAALPSAITLLLFYSLVLHVYLSLGGWPTKAMESLPEGLATHANITYAFFDYLCLSLLILPLPIIICLAAKRWRGLLAYIATHAGGVY